MQGRRAIFVVSPDEADGIEYWITTHGGARDLDAEDLAGTGLMLGRDHGATLEPVAVVRRGRSGPREVRSAGRSGHHGHRDQRAHRTLGEVDLLGSAGHGKHVDGASPAVDEEG